MNKKLLLAEVLLAFLVVVAFRYKTVQVVPVPQQASRQQAYQKRQVIHCSPDWNVIDADSLAAGIGPLPGIGNYQWRINSTSDSAVFYFNQGINLYYAFHIIESMASFKKAATFDSQAAMIYWAQALAYGPNINDYEYSAVPDAFAAAQKAVSLSAGCNEREKKLVAAMAIRYSLDTTQRRAALNQQYTARMQDAYQLFPKDDDIAVLYADAMMLEHPWDYWKHDGAAQPWTPKILSVLETALKQNPNQPAANHYYIHMVEASANPEKGLACAGRLGKLMPGVSHVVHMPSHIYIRTGNYKQGAQVNESAVKSYNNYLSLYPGVANNAGLYLIHNIHMQTANAMMMGSYAYSLQAARATQKSFDSSFLSFPAPFGTFVQYLYISPVFVMVRYGKWSAIMDHPAVPSQYHYANALWHWARGMALANENNIAAAKKELDSLQQQMKAPGMQVVYVPFNAPIAAAKVASEILLGRIAQSENNLPKALEHFKQAVLYEDALVYNEPRDWLLPAREWLGNAMLTVDAAAAEKVFRKDLLQSPNNIWSSYGCYRALTKQNKLAEAAVQKKVFDKISTGADIQMRAPVF